MGSEVILRGPQGVFTLDEEDLKKEIMMICTGTGIAPFRSMAHHLKIHNIPHNKIYLIYGTRTQEDLLYFEELKKLDLYTILNINHVIKTVVFTTSSLYCANKAANANPLLKNLQIPSCHHQ